MLLELLHRVAAHAGANGMDAGALGEVFAPVMAWQPPPPKKVHSPPQFYQRACYAPSSHVFSFDKGCFIHPSTDGHRSQAFWCMRV